MNANKCKPFGRLSEADMREMEERERLGYEKLPQTEEELAFIEEALKSSGGIWNEIDGLEYQQHVREEGEGRTPKSPESYPSRKSSSS